MFSPLARLALAFILSGIAVAAAVAQPPAPPPPAQYRVELRYRIDAPRVIRLEQFAALTRYLESIGFRKDPGEETEAEDPTATRMTGTIASASARKILLDTRVKSLLLSPAGHQLPEAPTALVKVQIELAAGLPPDRQRALADQVRPRLAALGFRENVGYDHRGHSRVVGRIPRKALSNLLEDLRWQPAGWLASAEPIAALPSPLQNVSPILVTEVLPEPEGAPAARDLALPPFPPADEPATAVEPGLAGPEGKAGDKPVRMEVFLSSAPAPADDSWRRVLTRAAPGLAVEGRLGPIVTVLGLPKDVAALADVPIVSGIRRARPALFPLQAPGGRGDNARVLGASGLANLHARGNRGRGVRVAVIDGDFRGYEKRLPQGARYVDLTAERNATVLPDEYPSPSGSTGHGTQCALALLMAAPEVDLTLIRIDPAAPHQMEEAARLIGGESFRSESYFRRGQELNAEADRLRRRREEIAKQREAFLESFGKEGDAARQREAIRKSPREIEEEARQRAEQLSKAEAELKEQEREHQQRQNRFLKLQDDLGGLRGIHVVTSGLNWNEGYPLGGNGILSRAFTGGFRSFWFQAAGNSRGQTWAGLFRDSEGNGVMEFASPEARLRPERWTSELNFLAWQPFGADQSLDLPAKAKVRLSVQWREVHDPEFFLRGEDVYRRPLANLRIVVLRQRDPSGKRLAADDMEVVAYSQGPAQRLDNQPASATYETWVEFSPEAAGRYAARLEGRVTPGIRPPGAPTLPALQKTWELSPRLFVEAIDAPSRLQGRPVFLDYATDVGQLGIPADSQGLFTVGAGDLSGQAQPYSTSGPPLNRSLLGKPEVLAFDAIELGLPDIPKAYGTSLAAPFAAGMAASWLSADVPPREVGQALRSQRGAIWRLP